jgi:hypothetical protein
VACFSVKKRIRASENNWKREKGTGYGTGYFSSMKRSMSQQSSSGCRQRLARSSMPVMTGSTARLQRRRAPQCPWIVASVCRCNHGFRGQRECPALFQPWFVLALRRIMLLQELGGLGDQGGIRPHALPLRPVSRFFLQRLQEIAMHARRLVHRTLDKTWKLPDIERVK